MVRFPNNSFMSLFTNMAQACLIFAQPVLTAVITEAAVQILHCIDQRIVAQLRVRPLSSGFDLLLSKRKTLDIFPSSFCMINFPRRMSEEYKVQAHRN